MRALMLVAVLAGCSELPDLGVCGNGIIEADNGEACDGTPGCNATCELACLAEPLDGYVEVTRGPEPKFCPSERFACGQDDICREPSGEFTTTGSAEPFDARSATTGDFDGDGIVDLVGTSATQIVARLGSQTTPFGDAVSQAAPSSESPIAIFDRDPQRQSMLPSTLALGVPSDGLSLLTSSTEVFEPDLDLAFTVDDTTRVVFTVRDPELNFLRSDTVYAVARTGTLTVERLAISLEHPARSLPPCGPPGSRLITIARAIDSFVVVGAPIVDNGTFFACRYAPPQPEPGPGDVFEMTITAVAAAPPTSAVLANLSPVAGCLDLVFARTGATTTDFFKLAGDPGNGCALLGTPNDFGFSGFPDDTLLAAGAVFATPEGTDQLIATHGVYVFGGLPVIGPTVDINAWTTAAVVDLNNDGHLDVVAGRQGQDDVDIVRGGVSLSAYRADTDARVTQVVPGDFDGDALGDVALVENQPPLGDRISILYGTSDGMVGAPVVNSKLEGELRIAPLRRLSWAGTTRGPDGIDDLLVARTVGNATRGGILYGDAPRLMTTLRLPPPNLFMSPGPIGTVTIGNFVDETGLVAAALRLEDRSEPDSASVLAFNDIATGLWSAAKPVSGFAVDTLRQPAVVGRQQGTPLIAAFSTPLSGMMGGSVVVAAIDATGANCRTPPLAGSAFALRGTDLDEDGTDELVVTLDQGRTIHVFSIDPGAPCTFGGAQLADALADCSDVVALGGGRAIALCEHGGRRVGTFRIVDGVREDEPFAVFDGVGTQLVPGDFDGDGVPDLAVGVARGGALGAVFLRQCPAHDTRGCR